ncbi:MAG: NAD(P)H:quinone oxidoreductase [Halofilum sp. (in: g-proteobacteria)]
MNVLIVYYSTYGNVYAMAREVAAGVGEVDGAEAIVRKAAELMPGSLIEGNEGMRRGRDLQRDIPEVGQDDFRDAGAFAFGTPTRYGNVAAQLKNEIDKLSALWLEGQFEDKPAGVFASTASLHGGQETTAFSLMAPLLHLGMVPVGVPYSTQQLFTTQSGGSPYGPGHVAGANNDRPLDEDEAAISRALGRRLARLGLKLQG